MATKTRSAAGGTKNVANPDAAREIADWMLRGFSAKTIYGGVGLDIDENALVAALGTPSAREDAVLGEGPHQRTDWYVNYHQDREIGGWPMREFVDFAGAVFPDGRRPLTSVSVMLHAPSAALADVDAAAAVVKLGFAERYAKGRSTTVFRAPELSARAGGFVALWWKKTVVRDLVVLRVTAGLD